MTDSTSGTISRSSFLRSFGGTKRLVHSPFFSPLYLELVMMDTNHSTRTPIITVVYNVDITRTSGNLPLEDNVPERKDTKFDFW